jgi:hypothetical protein
MVLDTCGADLYLRSLGPPDVLETEIDSGVRAART